MDWATNAIRLNFGESLIYHREAAAMIFERLPNTLKLAVTALILQLVIGVPLGVIAALRRGSWADGAIRVFGVAGHAVPAFWLGQVLIITAGTGRVQMEGGPIQVVNAGDVVIISAHVKHWHGAAPDSSMSHIAIQDNLDGDAVDWLEPVTDQQYNGGK